MPGPPERVLITSASIGGGHVAAGTAMFDAFNAPTFRRLCAVRKRVDPSGVFAAGHAIPSDAEVRYQIWW